MIQPKHLWACIFLWPLALVACSPYGSYQDILENPSVLKRSTAGELAQYSITFQPIWLKHLSQVKKLNEANTYKSLLTEYGNHLNFVLDLTLLNQQNEIEVSPEYLRQHLRFINGSTQWSISFIQEEQAGIMGLKRFLVSCELPMKDGLLEEDLHIELDIAAESQKTQLFHFSKKDINLINLVNG